MESTDKYPCFHTRLERTFRRRLIRPDGIDVGWLILTADDQFTEVATDGPASIDGLSDAVDVASRRRRDDGDPPRLPIPHPR